MIMKHIAAAIFFITLYAGAFAQKQAPADSVYWFEQSLRKIANAQQNAAALLQSNYEKVSTVSLAYQLQNGHFRTSQIAENDRNVAFNSSGISTLGRFKMSGYFNFMRTWQDSLAWTMQGLPNDATPYYFAAGKAGKYQRINYNFGGLLSYSIIKDKLYLAAGVDYLFNTASRSVDPRPNIQTFQLDMKPQVLYKTGRHLLGVGLNLGYGKEDNSVNYTSTQFAQGQAYPDRVNYLMMGYGAYKNVGAYNLKRKVSNTGFGFNYGYKKETTYINGALNYKHNVEKNIRTLDLSANKNSFGTFSFNNYSGTLLAGFKSKNYQNQLQADVDLQSGSDKNDVEYGGKRNYVYKKQYAAFNYIALKQSASATNAEFGLNLIYSTIDKRDIAANIASTFAYLQPGVSGGLYHLYNNQSKLSVALKPALRLPAGNKVNVPVTDNVFANHVVYPNYTYWSSTVAVLGFNARYITAQWFKDVNGVTINANYFNTLSTGPDYATTTFMPSGHRLDVTLGFNLYF